MYVNPIEILGLSNFQQASSIEIDIIKKSKRRLFADIDLSDDCLYDYYGSKITKSICEKAIDELNDKDKKDFYLYLANNQSLNLFLANGDESFFTEIKQDGIFKLDDFIEFISKFYAPRFDRALLNSFLKNDDAKIRKILSTSHLISTIDINISLKSVSNHIQAKIQEIDKITLDIKNQTTEYNEKNVIELMNYFIETLPAKSINCLPYYFSSQILKLANSVNYLSNAIWSNLDCPQISYLFVEYILTLNVSGIDKTTFEKNLLIISDENKKRATKIQNAPVFEKWETIVSFLDELKEKVDNKTVDSKAAWQIVKSKIDLKDINSIPDFGNDLRNQACISIRNLSISIWNHHNDIRTALEAINFCKLIKIQNKLIEKIKQDEKDLLDLEEKHRGFLICYFCDKNIPDDEFKIETTIYKEINRSGWITKNVEFSYVKVSIPRCKSCCKVHELTEKRYWLYSIACIVLGIIVGMLIEEHFVIGGFIGFAIGYLIALYKSIQTGVKNSSDSSLGSHPILWKKIQEGWTFSKPTA